MYQTQIVEHNESSIDICFHYFWYDLMYQTKIVEHNECSIAVFMISLKS